MQRRKFITLLGGAAAWPMAVRAQQGGERRIGVLMGMVENDPEARLRVAAFRQGLREIGWTESRNIHIEFRWAGDEPKLARAYAAELVGAASEIIVAHAALTVAAAQQQTRSLPIVFCRSPTPWAKVSSRALRNPAATRPGSSASRTPSARNGWSCSRSLFPRRAGWEIIRVPAKASSSQFLMRAIETLAASLKVQLTVVEVRDLAEIDGAFDTLSRASIEGLIVMPDPTTLTYRARIIELARERKIPAVYPYRYFTADGGLISYGPNGADIWRRTAFYVDRILKGAKAADLPVQNPTRFELVVNLETAKALGIELPLSLLMHIDEVIE